MIASILKLNRRDIQSLRVTDDYSLHRVVYSLFEDIRSDEEKHASVPSGFLFADKGGDINNRVILILSDREPRTPEFGTLESKAVGDAFLEHDHYQFEVLVNPTRRDNASGNWLLSATARILNRGSLPKHHPPGGSRFIPNLWKCA